MKLVLTRKTLPHGDCIQVDWPPNETDVSWVSLIYESSPEERRTGWVEKRSNWKAIFEGFFRVCMPNESHVYSCLVTHSKVEYKRILADLHEANLRFVTGEDIRSKKGLLRRLLDSRDPPYVFVAESSYHHVTGWYLNYGGWIVTPFRFIVSNKPLDDWVNRFLFLTKYRLGMDFLRHVGSYVTNHWEHGLEVISLDLKADALEAEAGEISRRLNIPLEVVETGVP